MILYIFSFIYANGNGIWTYPEDIRAGVFGLDENLDSSDNYTFNNIVYFNKDLVASNIQISHNISVGDSLEVQNNIFASRFRSIDNPSFFLNPSGSSTLYAIFAEAYFTSGMGNTYYLRPAQLSIVHSLRVDNNLDLRGEIVNGTVPWARLSEHPSIDAGIGLVGGGDLSQSRTIELDLDFTDNRYVLEGQAGSISTGMIQNGAITSAKIASNSVRVQELNTASVDSRYLRLTGGTMSGNLILGGNNINMAEGRIINVPNPTQNNHVANKAYVDSVAGGSMSCTTRQNTVSSWSGPPTASVSCNSGEIMTGGGCAIQCTNSEQCGDTAIDTNIPTSNGWSCGGFGNQVVAYARCCTIS